MPTLIARTPKVANGSMSLTPPRSLSSLLPAQDDPDYLWVLCEMIRADLEFNWAEHRPRRLEDYKEEFPELFSNRAVIRALASEEFQLREAYGDHPDPAEYTRDYGIELIEAAPHVSRVGSGVMTATMAFAIQPIDSYQVTPYKPHELPTANSSSYYIPLPNSPTPFPELSIGKFPELNEEILGFRIVEELGRGSFARVYLAQQTTLVDRLVALKVTTRPSHEADRLAKLQHTNIVPIYSVHGLGTMQGICMPYLGRSTLADTINAIRKQGLLQRSGSELFSTMVDQATVPDHPTEGPTVPKYTPVPLKVPQTRSVHAPQPVRDKLNAMPYLDAVAWLIARLADGLDHAHKRGIRHHDVKPANILLGDDGQPMLLDFNLAHDVTLGRRVQLGGTIMYMAPEQLNEVLLNKAGEVDERTDLYSLGVIFYELLTSQHPFPIHAKSEDKINIAMALRHTGPTKVRALNPTVPPSLEAIVHKLLQVEPRKRYQSAEQLRIDLDHHAQNYPLLFVEETSVREQFTKWRRRNPQTLKQLLLSAFIVTTIGMGLWAYQSNQAYHSRLATDTARTLHSDLTGLRVDLAAGQDTGDFAEGLHKAKTWLNTFAVPGSDPANHPTIRKLSPGDRAKALTDLGELAALVALSDTDEAEKWHSKSEQYISLANHSSLENASDWKSRDNYLKAIQLHRDGRIVDSMKALESVVAEQPEHYGAQFLLALCRADLHQSERAVERIEIARSLAPKDYRPSLNAGKVYLAINRFQDAETAFTRAIELSPTSPDCYTYRAKVRKKMGNLTEAMKDLDTAAALGGTPRTLLALRSTIHKQLGHADLAEKDLQALIAVPATTAYEYCLLGYALAADHPQAALEAFQQATALKPEYAEAWHNQGHLYIERLNEIDKGLEALSKAITSGPDFAESRMGRAVVLARLGRRSEAHNDVEAALLLPITPRLKYQAANVYSLTSAKSPKDAERAYSLLREAIRDGFNSVKLLEEDKDMANLRTQETYQAIVRGLKELVK